MISCSRVYLLLIHLAIVGVILLFLHCTLKEERPCPVIKFLPMSEMGPVEIGFSSIEDLGSLFHKQGDPQITNTFFNKEIKCFTFDEAVKDCPFGSQFFEAQQFVKWVMEKERLRDGNALLKKWPFHGLDYTVVEMGSMDGRTYSNNYFFEKQLGWRSVNIEPSRISFPQLVKNRPHAINLNIAGCLEERELLFRERKEDLAVSRLASLSEGEPGETYSVRCGPISRYLRLVGVERVELFFLDVEGAELTVLQSINFTSLPIHYMVVEFQELYNLNDSFSKIRNLLSGEGFTLIGKFGWDDKNELFVNEHF
jgi:FkbM family methyltransferase